MPGKAITCLLVALGLTGVLGTAARAETVLSVIQISYDADLRPQCSAVRMNPAVYGSLPASACTLGTTSPTNGYDRITETVYDAAGEVSQIVQAYGTADQRVYATYSYSNNGKIVDTIDANGNRSHTVYDGFDRLSTYDYPSATRPSSYNPATQATAIATAGAYSTTDYESYTYDANSNRLTTRRRDGQILSDCYDALNQVIIHYVHSQSGCTATGGAKDVYTTYDEIGHITSKRFASFSGAGVSYAYDGLGRLSSTTDYYGRTLSYQYDQASARTRLSWADGNYIGYSLDNVERLTSLGWDSTGGLFGESYTSLGQVHKLLRAGTISTSENPDGACVSQDGATCLAYDAIGRLTGYAQDLPGTSGDISWSFAYNPAGQLTSWSASSAVYDYQETNNETVNKSYDGLNRDSGLVPTSAICTAGGYDARANLICDGRHFTYDVENRLLTGTTLPGVNITLDYDPEGHLVSYTSGSTVTTFQYDGSDLIAEYGSTSSTATPLRRYVHGSGTDDPEIWFEGSGNSDIRYVYANYQGSVIATANASGTNLVTYKYGPYGEPKDAGNNDSWSGFRFRYTGQTMLGEAHLYYYKARVYDPATGHFLQTDPVGSKDDLDLYAYVGGDPINRADPDGTEFTFIGGAGVQGDYLKGFQSAFSDAGIQNVNVPEGQPGTATLAGDVLGVTSVNDLKFANSLIGTQTINDLAAHSNSMPDGEQFNLGGYSYGSAAAASAAYAIAQSGGHVDNLVLVGAPINKDLMDAVTSNPNIKNVINIDLSSHGDPIRAGMNDWQIAGTLPTLVGQMKDNAGHFYYSGTGATADDRRKALANELVKRGVR